MNTIDAVVAALPRVEEPIRAEVFGIERLEQHGESLAAAQPTADDGGKGRRLLPRVRENGKVLLAGYRDIVEAVRQKRHITQAEEWLLDNFHVVDGQIREIRDHLPHSFYRLLPKIADGHHLGGYPRVYGLAWAYVAHTDSRFELETLQAFVRAYQRVHPLGIGEIWAIAIHLRVALLENLRRLTEAGHPRPQGARERRRGGGSSAGHERSAGGADRRCVGRLRYRTAGQRVRRAIAATAP